MTTALDQPALLFGRSFETSDGRLIVSCFNCGTPLWGTAHICIGQDWRRFEQEVRELMEG